MIDDMSPLLYNMHRRGDKGDKGMLTVAHFRIKEIALKEQWQKRWSISKLAQTAGLSRPAVANLWNNTATGVQLDTLAKLAKVLNVPIGSLLGDGDPPDPPEAESA